MMYSGYFNPKQQIMTTPKTMVAAPARPLEYMFVFKEQGPVENTGKDAHPRNCPFNAPLKVRVCMDTFICTNRLFRLLKQIIHGRA
jgi:hypothetical protein